MTDSTPLLQVINRKELELRRRVEKARDQAEALLQAARAEAEQTIARADQEARAEAETLYRQGIEAAQAEAEALVATATEQAATLQQQAMANLDDAAQQIVELVLPFLAEAIHEELSQAEAHHHL